MDAERLQFACDQGESGRVGIESSGQPPGVFQSGDGGGLGQAGKERAFLYKKVREARQHFLMYTTSEWVYIRARLLPMVI